MGTKKKNKKTSGKLRLHFQRMGRRFVSAFKDSKTYIFILVAFLVILATIAVFKTETKTDSGIESKFDSIWFTFVALFAGYFDYVVKSYIGRFGAAILLILGIILISTITGKISSMFMDSLMKKDRGLARLKSMNRHFLICGWRKGFDKILDAVLNSNPDITPDLIVLVNDAPSEEFEKISDEKRFKGINYISGDFADEATLKRAKIETAARALIISDQSKKYSQLEVDSRTVLAVLTMKNINPSVYIAAELSDSKFQNHLSLAHCDEIILTSDYEYSLLATASSGMGYSNVIRTLIGDDAESGILIEPIPSAYIGKSYGEYKKSLSSSDGIIIGLLLNTGNFHERRKDALREAQKNPDIKTIVSNLQKVKTLKSNEPVLTPSDDFVIQPFTKAIFVRG